MCAGARWFTSTLLSLCMRLNFPKVEFFSFQDWRLHVKIAAPLIKKTPTIIHTKYFFTRFVICILTQFISEQRRGLIFVIFASVSPKRGLMFPKRGLMLFQRGLMIFWSKLLPAQEDLWSEKKMSWPGFEPGTFWLPVLRTTTELRSHYYLFWWKLQIHIQ